MSKKIFLSMCVVGVFSCALQGAAMRKGPYLYYPGYDESNVPAMTVLWQLHETVACTLEWWEENTPGVVGSAPSNEYGDDHQHKITIPSLVPGSKYCYKVDAGGGDVYEGTFYAAPDYDATTLKFLAYGDTRSHPWDHNTVCEGMVDAFEADPAFQTLALLSGDFVGSGTSEEDWDIEYFGGCPGYYLDDDGVDEDPNNYWGTIEMLANLPINGCVGNHEALTTKTLFRKYWPYPFVDGFYWSFEYGPALFLVVDQYDENLNRMSSQLAWIEEQLATTSKQWKFIILHAPGYSAGGGHPDERVVQMMIQPLCVEYGVDIIFGGHNHYYSRCEVEGVQHITTGGGGAPLRDPEPDYSEYVLITRNAFNFCEIEIDGNELYFEAWDVNEANSVPLIDSFTITH